MEYTIQCKFKQFHHWNEYWSESWMSLHWLHTSYSTQRHLVTIVDQVKSPPVHLWMPSSAVRSPTKPAPCLRLYLSFKPWVFPFFGSMMINQSLSHSGFDLSLQPALSYTSPRRLLSDARPFDEWYSFGTSSAIHFIGEQRHWVGVPWIHIVQTWSSMSGLQLYINDVLVSLEVAMDMEVHVSMGWWARQSGSSVKWMIFECTVDEWHLSSLLVFLTELSALELSRSRRCISDLKNLLSKRWVDEWWKRRIWFYVMLGKAS